MLFTSLEFLLMFMPVAYGVHFLLPGRMRNVWLFLCSLFFYAWGEPVYVLVMLGSIVLNYGLALGMDRQRDGKRKALLAAAVICNLGMLLVFKYLNFLTANMRALGPGFASLIPQTRILLPIGISFFTFQAMSYVIDAYRGLPAQRNPVRLGLYISLFPQLIAGPIVRYRTIAEQMENRKISFSDFSEGTVAFLRGFNKKILLANVLGEAADYAFSAQGNSVCMAWLGAVCYALQIYFDFSGYSEMAIGLGRMLGFRFERNFDHPYASRTVSEFWRRWHISLGTWFRDYVYFPMGGSRVNSNLLLIRNLMTVWLLTGIWHGAEWTFLLWGLSLGLLISLEKILQIPRRLKEGSAAVRVLYQAFALLAVLLGWVLFRAENLPAAGQYFGSLFGLTGNRFTDDVFRFQFREYLIPLAAAVLASMPWETWLRKSGIGQKAAKTAEALAPFLQLLLFIISFSCLVMSAHNPFIYFHF